MAHDVTKRIHRYREEEFKHAIGDDEVFGSIMVNGIERRYAAVKTGGNFHASTCYFESRHSHDGETREWYLGSVQHGDIYAPVHPSTTYEDVEGATYAHDDGTYWIFAHCSPGEQRDFAEVAAQFTMSLFDPAIKRANLLLGNATDSTRTDRYHRARAFVDFAEQSANEARRIVLLKPLGYYHKDPHHDHRRDIALAATNAVWAAWLKNSSRIQDRDRIDATRQTIKTSLESTPTIDFQYQRDDEAAARGDDPVRGNEYCYTLKATADAITGDANVPDPNWEFDAFPKSGMITRGTQTYHDKQPSATEAMPFVIRFKRPVPAGTNRGVSIGSVAWVQEEAVREG